MSENYFVLRQQRPTLAKSEYDSLLYRCLTIIPLNSKNPTRHFLDNNLLDINKQWIMLLILRGSELSNNLKSQLKYFSMKIECTLYRNSSVSARTKRLDTMRQSLGNNAQFALENHLLWQHRIVIKPLKTNICVSQGIRSEIFQLYFTKAIR